MCIPGFKLLPTSSSSSGSSILAGVHPSKKSTRVPGTSATTPGTRVPGYRGTGYLGTFVPGGPSIEITLAIVPH
eukprot:975905-Rhodomonas_salina.1